MRAIKVLITINIVLLLISCSQQNNPLSSDQFDGQEDPRGMNQNIDIYQPAPVDDLYPVISDNRPIRIGEVEVVEGTNSGEYPQYASCIVTFDAKKQVYNGSACQLRNGSSFEITRGALTPPDDHPLGEPVKITMMATMDEYTNEIIFTFGPSGCTFEPSAEVWLKWTDLGCENATLFYLDENGNPIEELPDNIEIANKQMCLYIDHFSRYSVAYSN